MALHPDFPASPYAELLPDQRWFPAAEELRSTAYEKLLPPLVAKIREEVNVWRTSGYDGASTTSKCLLHWWFDTEHMIEQADAKFLDDAPDVVAFAKNYLAVGFKIEYVKANGDLSNYIPDFIVRTTDSTVWIVETKGRAELDLPQKMNRLAQWCADATSASLAEGGPAYCFVYVDQEGFERNPPNSMAALATAFSEYQPR